MNDHNQENKAVNVVTCAQTLYEANPTHSLICTMTWPSQEQGKIHDHMETHGQLKLLVKDTLHEIGNFFLELRFILKLILKEHDSLDPNHFKS